MADKITVNITKWDYEPTWAYEATDTTERQNNDPVRLSFEYGGDGQPDPFRHLGKGGDQMYEHESEGPDPWRDLGKGGGQLYDVKK
jgi:hypothetical protein